MPRRSHDRRRSGPADRVLDRLAKGAAGGCRATVVEAEGGLVRLRLDRLRPQRRLSAL
jgi:hypothetical protein